jgi:dTDP-4-dehydrorhamnose reductase
VRILILGGDGMLGHQLLRSLQGRHELCATLRGPLAQYARYGIFNAGNAIAGVAVGRFDTVERALDEHRPQAVVNAIGIVKQRAASQDAIASIQINALFPHRLALACGARAIRLVHMSTDCVFSGRKGGYKETDLPDPVDLYGRSKLLGEVSDVHCLTLRTSIIGRELARKASLVEWYLSQRGTIRGFAKAIYSGFTTLEMARIIERLLLQHPDLSGVWHVASPPISKFELLSRLTAILRRDDTIVERDERYVCDRSLDASAFASRTGHVAPAWDVMLGELGEQILQERQLYDL